MACLLDLESEASDVYRYLGLTVVEPCQNFSGILTVIEATISILSEPLFIQTLSSNKNGIVNHGTPLLLLSFRNWILTNIPLLQAMEVKFDLYRPGNSPSAVHWGPISTIRGLALGKYWHSGHYLWLDLYHDFSTPDRSRGRSPDCRALNEISDSSHRGPDSCM